MLLVVIVFFLPGIALAAPAKAQELADGGRMLVEVDALDPAITADLDSPWQFVSNGADCRLEQLLGSYGTARFMGVSGQPLRFEVVGHRPLFAEGAIDVVQTSPEWHPEHPQQQLLGQATNLAGGGIAAGDPIATRILLGLFGGYDIWMVRHAWFAEDQAVGVKLASVGVRGHYWQFTECFKGPLLRSWAEVERTRIGFLSGAAALDDSRRCPGAGPGRRTGDRRAGPRSAGAAPGRRCRPAPRRSTARSVRGTPATPPTPSASR